MWSTGFSIRWLLLLRSMRSMMHRLQWLWRRALVALWHVESFQTRDQTRITCIGRQIPYPLHNQGSPGPDFFLRMLGILIHFNLTTTLWDWYFFHFKPEKTEVQRLNNCPRSFPSPIHTYVWLWGKLSRRIDTKLLMVVHPRGEDLREVSWCLRGGEQKDFLFFFFYCINISIS